MTFALTRKRLGMVYGRFKLVSAVAVIDTRGAEDLHSRFVETLILAHDKNDKESEM